MSRRTSEANKAIAAAWANEKELVNQGQGTRDWSREQQQDILERGKAYDENGKAFEGHHMKSVEKFPEYQGNAQNIQLLSRPEHAEAHNGNFQNSTNGFYNYVTKQTIGFGENEFKPCEIVYLSDPIFPPNVSSESKYISELEDNGKDSASENNNADNAQKANLKQEKMQPSKTPVSVSKPKRGFSDRIMGVVEKVNDFQYKHPIISEVAKIVVPLAVGAGVDHLAGGGKRKSRSISSKPSVSRTSSVKNTGPSVEKVVNAATKVAETIEKSSPIEHTVSGHRQRYNGVWKDKAPYKRGGK